MEGESENSWRAEGVGAPPAWCSKTQGPNVAAVLRPLRRTPQDDEGRRLLHDTEVDVEEAGTLYCTVLLYQSM